MMTIKMTSGRQRLAAKLAVAMLFVVLQSAAPNALAGVDELDLTRSDGHGDLTLLQALDDYRASQKASFSSSTGPRFKNYVGGGDTPVAAKLVASYGTLTPISGTKNSELCLGSRGVAVDPSGHYVYFSGGIGSPGRLCGFTIDPVTRAFTPLAGTPVAMGSNPSTVAIEPSGRFLYGLGGNGVWGYSTDRATGALTPLAGSPFAAGPWLDMVIDRGGRFVYLAQSILSQGTFKDSIAVFALDRATGALTPIAGSPFSVSGASKLAFSPDGRFLFTGNATVAVNATTGAITPLADGSNFFVGGVAVDPTGRFLYVLDAHQYVVHGFAIASNGALTPIGTQPTATPDVLFTSGITILGDLLYVANTPTNHIYGFRINASSGALVPVAGSPFAAGPKPNALAGISVLPIAVTVDAGDAIVGSYGALGGQPPYAWSITTGTLPPGLSLNVQTGVISGTVGGTGEYTFTAQVADSAGSTVVERKSINVAGGTIPTPITVVEFYNASLDHYFITYVTDEIAKLDNGTFKGWARTNLTFKAFTSAAIGTSAVCRIYIPPGKGDGHFFGRDAVECDGTISKNPTFILESGTFLNLYPPTLGNCGAGQVPVYRAFSNRTDANHRYTTDRAVRDQMVGKGWLAEGDGADTVVMCAPV